MGPACQRGRERGREGHLSVTLRVVLHVEKRFAEGYVGGLLLGLVGWPVGFGPIHFFYTDCLFLFLFDFSVLNFNQTIKHSNDFKSLPNLVFILILFNNTKQNPKQNNFYSF